MREPWLPDVAEQIDPFYTKSSRDRAHQECWRKERYYAEHIAREAARKARLAQHDDGSPIHHYLCLYESGLGRHWHLGHQSWKYSHGEETSERE